MTTANDSSMQDIRPVVAEDRGNRPLWLGIAGIILLGLFLFVTLETRRREASAPATQPRASELTVGRTTVPPLYVPPPPSVSEQPVSLPEALPSAVSPSPSPEPRPSPAAERVANISAPVVTPLPTIVPSTSIQAAPPGPAIVYDASIGQPVDAGQAGSPGANAPAATVANRARAGRSVNSGTTVPQGTLISAVLETAIDSTQPGQTRALVSRDIVNLRGDRVLIPRGSRLFGNYRGELASGQKRAQVEWTRLLRPDGVTIALDSPAADRLGRAGVRGRVDTHFLERLGGALLQTSIDVGGALATRSISGDTVIVALPGAVQGSTSQLVGAPPKPTLKVRQGTRISVFVARDLDFTGVEARR